jgi:NADH dehydrogenase/NADH:ubiquinone oxidoreductase subunit G
MDLRKLIIDGTEIEVDPRLTLLQACARILAPVTAE